MVKIKRVFEQIQERIERDALQLTPGEYLLSEMQYARTLDVSRLTVRKAVDELVRIGLVQRVPGKGLMVSNKKEPAPQDKLLLSLCFVTCDTEFYQTMMGCIDRANDLHYDYKILSFTNVKDRLAMLEKEDLSQYKGAVISFYESDEDKQVHDMLDKAGVPTILMGDNDNNACIGSDDFNGGYIMGEYLAQHGHKDILFITSDRPVMDIYKRTEGFKRALLDNDLPVRDEYFLTVKDDGIPILPQNAQQRALPPEAEAFLSRKLPFTALAGYSTLPILSMLDQMTARGFRIPEDVSVIGYGNYTYYAQQGITLTSVLSPTYEQGARAIDLMDDYLSGRSKTLQSDMLPVSFSRQKSVKRITH